MHGQINLISIEENIDESGAQISRCVFTINRQMHIIVIGFVRY